MAGCRVPYLCHAMSYLVRLPSDASITGDREHLQLSRNGVLVAPELRNSPFRGSRANLSNSCPDNQGDHFVASSQMNSYLFNLFHRSGGYFPMIGILIDGALGLAHDMQSSAHFRVAWTIRSC